MLLNEKMRNNRKALALIVANSVEAACYASGRNAQADAAKELKHELSSLVVTGSDESNRKGYDLICKEIAILGLAQELTDPAHQPLNVEPQRPEPGG